MTVTTIPYSPFSINDDLEELYSRVGALEQGAYGGGSGGYVGGSYFPGGITIGGTPVPINTSISTPTTPVAVGGSFLDVGFIDVAWGLPDTTITRVEVFYAKKDVITGLYSLAQSVTAGGNYVRIEPLTPGDTYGIYVVGLNNIGIPSPPEPPLSGGLPTYIDCTVPLDSTVPSPPGGVQAVLGATSVVVTWDAVTDPGVLQPGGYYEVQLYDAITLTLLQDWKGRALVMSFDGLHAATSPTNPTTNPYIVQVRSVTESGVPSSWTAFSSVVDGGGLQGGDIIARSIAAVSIVAGTITANEISANTITAGNIAANTITAAQLAAIQLNVGQYIRSTSYTPGSTGWNIAADGTAEFNNVIVRGTVASSTIVSSIIESSGSGARIVIYNSVQSWSIWGVSSSITTPQIAFFSGSQAYPSAIGAFVDGNGNTGIDIAVGNGTTGVFMSDISIASDGIIVRTPANKNFSVICGSGGVILLESPLELTAPSALGIFLLTYINGGGPNPSLRPAGSNGGLMVANGRTGTGVYDIFGGTIFSKTDGGGTYLIGQFTGINVGLGSDGFGILQDNGSFLPIYGGTYNTISGRDLKQDIAALDPGHLASLHKLRPVSFRMREGDTARPHLGLIAEEVAEHFPHLVSDVVQPGGRTTKGLFYSELIPVLILAIQDLQRQVKALQSTKS